MLVRVVKYQGMPVRVVVRENANYIPAEDLGEILGFSEPRKAVLKIFERNREELAPHSGIVKLTTPGGVQKTRVFTETGAYLVAMFARTPKAKEVRRWLAELPRMLRKGSVKALEGVAGEIAVRLMGIMATKSFQEMEMIARLVWLRKRGLTQVEAGRVLGLKRHQVQGLERWLKSQGLMLPVARKPSAKAVLLAMAQELGLQTYRSLTSIVEVGNGAQA